MGHIRNCCPTATSANVNMASAPAFSNPDDQPSLEEEGVVCFCVTGEERGITEDEDETPQSSLAPPPAEFGESPSEMDHIDETPDHSPSSVALLSTAALPPHLAESANQFPVGTVDPLSSITMEPLLHMEFVNKEFQRRKPKDAPMLDVSCKLLHELHARYGKLLSSSRRKKAGREPKTSGLADTGAQICTAGNGLLVLLGIDESSLLLTGMSVSGLSNSRVNVLGTLFLEISANGRYTRQLVYIANEARSLILSEKALIDP